MPTFASDFRALSFTELDAKEEGCLKSANDDPFDLSNMRNEISSAQHVTVLQINVMLDYYCSLNINCSPFCNYRLQNGYLLQNAFNVCCKILKTWNCQIKIQNAYEVKKSQARCFKTCIFLKDTYKIHTYKISTDILSSSINLLGEIWKQKNKLR